MKYFAVVLSLIAIGLYTWPFLSSFLNEENLPQTEVFPTAMMDVQPVGDVLDLHKQLAQEHQQLSQIEDKPVSDTRDSLEKVEKEDSEEGQIGYLSQDSGNQVAPQGICLKLGPVGTQQLPVINKTVEQNKLLEQVSVEPILGADHWVVFLVPSNSQKGAQTQAEQMKKMGYQDAKVINNGPLANGVSLGVFSEEAQAQTFFEQVQNKTRLQGVRVTRMIGEPTNKVFLMFTNLSQEQAKQVQSLGLKHKQQVGPCF